MALAWDTAHDTSWTYSNNDQSAAHPGGNSVQYLKTNAGIPMLNAVGTTHYVEVHTSNIGTASGGWYFGVYDQDATVEQNLLSNIHGSGYLSFNPTTINQAASGGWIGRWGTTRLRGSGTPMWGSPAPGWNEGDVIGYVVDCVKYPGHRCITYNHVYVFWNGEMVGHIPIYGHDDFQNHELYMGLRIQANGTPAGTFTIVDDPDNWSYDVTGLWPWVQAWSGAVETPDTSYDDEFRMFGWSSGLIQSITATNDRTAAMNPTEVGRLTTRPPSSGSAVCHADSTHVRADGKYYAELTVNQITPSGSISSDFSFGISACEAAVYGGGNDISRAMYEFGNNADQWRLTGGTTGSSASFGNLSANDVVMMAFDFGDSSIDETDGAGDKIRAWVGLNGTWQGDPAAGTGGITLNAFGQYGGPFILRYYAPNSTSHGILDVTINGGQTAFAYTVPTGFEAWGA